MLHRMPVPTKLTGGLEPVIGEAEFRDDSPDSASFALPVTSPLYTPVYEITAPTINEILSIEVGDELIHLIALAAKLNTTAPGDAMKFFLTDLFWR